MMHAIIFSLIDFVTIIGAVIWIASSSSEVEAAEED
jgi:hypothetical protein